MSDTNNATTIAELAVKAAGVPTTIKTSDGREFLVLPDGVDSKEVTDAYGLKLAPPRYISQSVVLETVDSLVDYVNRFQGTSTLLFANISSNVIAALIDYHAAAGAGGTAAHVAHKATMTLPFSEEWKLWTAISGQLKPQLEFARFIEENAAEISAPPAGDLLDAVRDLQAHRKVNFIKAVRTSSENENFEFADESEAKTRGGIELPTKFVLALPVYFGEPATELHAFLRWKIDADKGGLALGIQLHRMEHVRQAVFKQIVLAASERTGCPVMFGRAG